MTRFNSTGSPNSLSKNVQFQVCKTAASLSHNTLGGSLQHPGGGGVGLVEEVGGVGGVQWYSH